MQTDYNEGGESNGELRLFLGLLRPILEGHVFSPTVDRVEKGRDKEKKHRKYQEAVFLASFAPIEKRRVGNGCSGGGSLFSVVIHSSSHLPHQILSPPTVYFGHVIPQSLTAKQRTCEATAFSRG